MSSTAKGDGETGWVMFFLLVCLIMLGAFAWYLCRYPILEILRWLRWAEALLVTPFGGDQISACRQWLSLVRLDDENPSREVVRWTQSCFGSSTLSQPNNMYFYGLDGVSIYAVEAIIAPYFRWIYAGIFGWIVVHIFYFSPHMKFKTRHTLESFIKAQAKMWPIIRPIVDFDPAKSSARIPGSEVPDKLPLFAEALSPEEWIAWQRIPVVNGVPDREAARRAFLLQLGPRWNGIDGLPPYMVALLAAFALKGVQRRDESDALLGKIALAWTAKGGFNASGELMGEIKRLMRDPEVGGKIIEITDQHAFRTTAMLGALRWARWMGGVLASSQFLWLRGVDRGLWYPLNNLGRRSFHIEGAGALAHFMAEQAAKKPLPIPRIDTAIVTLNKFLSDSERPSLPIPSREGDRKKIRKS